MFDCNSAWEVLEAKQALRSGEPIGPSGVGGCPRQQALRFLGVPGAVQRSTAAADVGTMIHHGYQALMRSAPGFDHERVGIEVEVQASGMPRAGMADIVDWEDCRVIDIKTMGGRAWSRRVDAGGPYPSQWDQVLIYALGLSEMTGRDDWSCGILAINRDTGERVFWERQADLARARELVDGIAAKHEELTLAASVVAAGADPVEVAGQFPRGGDRVDAYPCSFCEFSEGGLCWPQPTAPDRSPMSETVAGDHVEILGHAEGYMAAKAEESKWKKVADTHRGYLAGLDGEYESPDGQLYRVAMVGGFQGADVPDLDALVEAFGEMGMEVPMKPAKPTARYVRVSRRATG